MGKNSEYHRKTREQKLAKLHELEAKLPYYAVAYLDDKELSSQPNTVVGYAYDLLTFFSYLKDKNPACRAMNTADIPASLLDNLTFADINEYQKYLEYNANGVKHNNGESGIARRMAALRGMFHFCCMHGYLTVNPVLGAARRKKRDDKDIIRMNAQEVGELLSVVENTNLKSGKQRKFCQKTQLRDTAILTLLLNTGIRVSECVGLDIGDINFRENTMGILRKGGKTQRIKFNDDVSAILMDYIENERSLLLDEEIESKALFLSSKKRRMCVKSVENVVKKYAAEAVPDKHITAHKCRSTYGTALYRTTGDIYLVAHMLGHKDINTTSQRYSAMDEEYSKKAASLNIYEKEKRKDSY